MSDVSMIGLGAMGSALARTFVTAGHRVTVWNRTAARAQPLVALGAKGAASLVDAVRASSIILVCIDNYAATREILEAGNVFENLAGRTLIQLSTGTPREARESEVWLNAGSVEYIDGAILGGPAAIGTANALILFGGPKVAYQRCAPLLKSLGGNLRYLGENIGAPAALDLAWLCQRLGLFLGLAHGALLCETEKVGTDLYASMFPEGDRARAFAEVIHAKAYENPSASLAVWYAAFQRIQSQARDAGIRSEIPDLAVGLFKRALAAGHGAEDVAALIKVLRKQSSEA
jgi:3-hydroxyisobutyrate dehydrogenase-like beta-hydroxyacid dehydrogenase